MPKVSIAISWCPQGWAPGSLGHQNSTNTGTSSHPHEHLGRLAYGQEGTSMLHSQRIMTRSLVVGIYIEIRSHCAAQTALELTSFLPQPMIMGMHLKFWKIFVLQLAEGAGAVFTLTTSITMLFSSLVDCS